MISPTSNTGSRLPHLGFKDRNCQMIFDTYEEPLSEEGIEAVKQNARERLRLWRKRALSSTGAFFLTCASVVPFLEGHSLHSHWESFGKYLVLLSMALLPVFVCGLGLWWGAWRALCDLDKTYP
jgi:hypothetical protein